jgi:hypothetical protein
MIEQSQVQVCSLGHRQQQVVRLSLSQDWSGQALLPKTKEKKKRKSHCWLIGGYLLSVNPWSQVTSQ